MSINKIGKQIRSPRKILICIAFGALIFIGCKKFITVPPPENRITQENVFAEDFTAISVLNNLYGITIQVTLAANLPRYTGLSGDDFTLWPNANATHQAYYTNQLQSTQSVQTGIDFWNECYARIYICNSAIEGISASPTLSPTVSKQLLGEAYFMRAFYYHYVSALYGDVPLAKGTDPEINRQLTRLPMDEVYSFIISDLKEAQNLLSKQYLNGNLTPYKSGEERVRPSYWAATALLARVYLYQGDNVQAEAAAEELINNVSLFNLPALSQVFLKSSASMEAIWQLQPVLGGQNTAEGVLFNLRAAPKGLNASKPLQLSRLLMQAFEPNDQRAIPKNWVDTLILPGDTIWFPNKYKVGADPAITSLAAISEYSTVLRLGEQYLIRAEARAKQGNLTGAKADLNKIRQRANLPVTTASDQISILQAIFRERRVELFSEWAHRWIDLRRSGNITNIMNTVSPSKGGNWEPTDSLYPIPFVDLQANPRLIQNQGY